MNWTTTQRNESIFKVDNKYGYIVKVNHRLINPLYNAFRKKLHLPVYCPMSDAERWQFELEVASVYFMEFLAFYNDNLEKMELICRAKCEAFLKVISNE